MGMSAITSDMAKQRRALLSSFLDAEAAASMHLGEVDAVRSAVEAACDTQLPSPLHPDTAPAVSLGAGLPGHISFAGSNLHEAVCPVMGMAATAVKVQGLISEAVQNPANVP